MTAPTPGVVVLCGSTRFRDELAATERELALAGHIVLGVTPFPDLTDADRAVLDEVHRRKIDLADRVVVVAPGGYVGESTRGEIAYAEKQGVPVEYRDPWASMPGSDHASPVTCLCGGEEADPRCQIHGQHAYDHEDAWTDEARAAAYAAADKAIDAAHQHPQTYGCCFTGYAGAASSAVLDALAPFVAAREAAAQQRGAERERKRHGGLMAILADEWADDPEGARDWARAYRVARATTGGTP